MPRPTVRPTTARRALSPARSLQMLSPWEGIQAAVRLASRAKTVSARARAIAAQLDIDVADQGDQMAPLSNMPQLTLYRAIGGVTNVVFMKALQPPVEPQEDYDLSDEDDDYDWYTLTSRQCLASTPPVAYTDGRYLPHGAWRRASWRREAAIRRLVAAVVMTMPTRDAIVARHAARRGLPRIDEANPSGSTTCPARRNWRGNIGAN